MTSEQLAATAGGVWLDSGISRSPDCNELSEIALRFDPAAESLAVVKACVPIADAVAWLLECRRNHPNTQSDIPVW